MTGGSRRGGGVAARVMWASLAIISAAVVFLVTNVTQGECYDSGTDPAASYCTSAPMVGVAGVWALWILWGVLAAFCFSRIVRRAPSHEG